MNIAVLAVGCGSAARVGHAHRRLDKRTGVEPFTDGVRIEIAMEARVPVWADGIACVTVTRRVVTKLRREGKAGLQRDDGAGRPASDKSFQGQRCAGEKATLAAEGKL